LQRKRWYVIETAEMKSVQHDGSNAGNAIMNRWLQVRLNGFYKIQARGLSKVYAALPKPYQRSFLVQIDEEIEYMETNCSLLKDTIATIAVMISEMLILTWCLIVANSNDWMRCDPPHVAEF
jgi:hypothetical protein